MGVINDPPYMVGLKIKKVKVLIVSWIRDIIKGMDELRSDCLLVYIV